MSHNEAMADHILWEDPDDEDRYYSFGCPHAWCINVNPHYGDECYSQDMVQNSEAWERRVNSWWFRLGEYLKARLWPDRCIDCDKRFGRHDSCLPF